MSNLAHLSRLYILFPYHTFYIIFAPLRGANMKMCFAFVREKEKERERVVGSAYGSIDCRQCGASSDGHNRDQTANSSAAAV